MGAAGEMLVVAEDFLTKQAVHPTQIVNAYARALSKALEVAERIATKVAEYSSSQAATAVLD